MLHLLLLSEISQKLDTENDSKFLKSSSHISLLGDKDGKKPASRSQRVKEYVTKNMFDLSISLFFSKAVIAWLHVHIIKEKRQTKKDEEVGKQKSRNRASQMI